MLSFSEATNKIKKNLRQLCYSKKFWNPSRTGILISKKQTLNDINLKF